MVSSESEKTVVFEYLILLCCSFSNIGKEANPIIGKQNNISSSFFTINLCLCLFILGFYYYLQLLAID